MSRFGPEDGNSYKHFPEEILLICCSGHNYDSKYNLFHFVLHELHVKI